MTPIPHAMVQVKVVPGSSRSGIAGRYGGGIKIQTSAPAQKGLANAAAVELLAAWLKVPQRAIALVSSPSNPHKRFRIEGMTQAALDARISQIA